MALRDRPGTRWLAGTLVGTGILATAYARPAGQDQEHVGQYARADVEYGLRLYRARCAACHGENGDTVSGVNLRSGQFRRASHDRALGAIITDGIPGTVMPAGNYDPAEVAALVAYLRSMGAFDPSTVAPGDAARGRLVFEGAGACTTCHRVNGRGSRTAPDLSNIGALRPAGALERALLDPTSAMFPINRPVRAITADGGVVRGRRLNEDTHTVQVIDVEGRLVSLDKADLREYEILSESPMPSYRDRLTRTQLADVLAYLLSLKDELP
jgi:putative heme-binding domain-containing protein